MGRSRLPLPSLLGALLILSPELLLGGAQKISEVPVTDPKVQEALASAVERYNKDRGASVNYFKHVALAKVLKEVDYFVIYHFMMELVETKCKKKAGMVMRYKNFQKCPDRPGNNKKPICHLEFMPRHFLMSQGHLESILCY